MDFSVNSNLVILLLSRYLLPLYGDNKIHFVVPFNLSNSVDESECFLILALQIIVKVYIFQINGSLKIMQSKQLNLILGIYIIFLFIVQQKRIVK